MNSASRVPHFPRILYRSDWLAVIFLLCAAVGFCWRVVFLGQAMLPADVIYTVEPWKSELFEQNTAEVWNPNLTDQIWQMVPIGSYLMRVHQGGGLLWDPYMMGGMPALARGDLFSNPIFHLFSSFLPLAAALSWIAFSNVLLASLFTYLLLREMGAGWFGGLVAALAFAYGGYLVGWLSLTHISSGMIWMPLIFWAFERSLRRQDWRWAIAGAFFFLFHVLSGFILWPFYGAITLFIWALYRGLLAWLKERKWAVAIKPVWYACLILGIGVLLAAPQLLLTLELYFNSLRTQQTSAAIHLNWASHIVRLLAPILYGNDVYGNTYTGRFNYPETALYWGVLPLIFILASWWGKHRKLSWGLSALGLTGLLAVYNIWPFRQIITSIYPVFLHTFPGRIFYIVSFAGAVAAGLGADRFSEKPGPRASIALSILSGLFAAALIFFTVLVMDDPEALSVYDLSSLGLPVVILIASSLLLYIYGVNWIKPLVFKTAALGIILIDLFTVGVNYNATFDPAIVFPETPSLHYLASLSEVENEPYRVLNVNSGAILLGMTPQIYQLQTISGYSSWVLKRFSEYTYLTGDRFKNFHRIYFTSCCDRLTNALNVKYIYTSPGIVPSNPEDARASSQSPIRQVYDGPNKVYENHEALPRAWIVHQVEQVQRDDFEAVKAKLEDPDLDLKTRAVIEIDDPDRPVVGLGSKQDFDEDVRIMRYLPERVEIATSLQAAGLLVLADNYYPGWKVYVDGQATPILPTNLTMRGVFLSEGQHQVRFVYQPDLLWIGLTVASLTMIGVLAALLAKAKSSVL
jgi:uncharacterized membrane protein YfhO